MKSLFLFAAAALPSLAFADANVQHDVDDYFCVSPNPIVEICRGLEGVAHVTTSASGNVNAFVIGETWMEVTVNGVVVDSSSRSGKQHSHSRDGELTGLHLDQCRETTLSDGSIMAVDTRVQVANGELINESVEIVESCD